MSQWHRDNPELVDTPADPSWQPPAEPPLESARPAESTELQQQLEAAWTKANAALKEVEPLLYARISEIVREEFSNAVAIWIEPCDQNSFGWVLIDVELVGGHRVDSDLDHDQLWPMLDDLGHVFLSSDTTPYPYRLELEER